MAEQRLIDANEAIEKINGLCVDGNENWIGTENQSFVDLSDVVDILADAPTVDAVPVEGNLGLILTCAERYACGRRTFMPSIVIGFITPLILRLDDDTLAIFDRDLTEAQYAGGYGDPKVDEPGWKEFHALIRQERNRRGCELYKSWRE